VEVRPVDVNASNWDCTLEAGEGTVPALRLGFRMLSGLQRSTVDRIVAARSMSPFTSQAEFEQRTQLSQSELSLLARGDVFGSFRTGRRTALWNALPAPDHSPLFAPLSGDEPSVPLPAMTAVQEVVADYQTTGLSLQGHPFQFLRAELDRCGVTPNNRLAHVESDRRYRIAGVVLLRQRPATAKGITFVTIEDETGTANLIIHMNTWERFRPVARGASAFMARGLLQRQHGICHLLVDRLDDLTDVLGAVTTRSRDFR
jgi:error-prone DNA polymerase